MRQPVQQLVLLLLVAAATCGQASAQAGAQTDDRTNDRTGIHMGTYKSPMPIRRNTIDPATTVFDPKDSVHVDAVKRELVQLMLLLGEFIHGSPGDEIPQSYLVTFVDKRQYLDLYFYDRIGGRDVMELLSEDRYNDKNPFHVAALMWHETKHATLEEAFPDIRRLTLRFAEELRREAYRLAVERFDALVAETDRQRQERQQRQQQRRP